MTRVLVLAVFAADSDLDAIQDALRLYQRMSAPDGDLRRRAIKFRGLEIILRDLRTQLTRIARDAPSKADIARAVSGVRTFCARATILGWEPPDAWVPHMVRLIAGLVLLEPGLQRLKINIELRELAAEIARTPTGPVELVCASASHLIALLDDDIPAAASLASPVRRGRGRSTPGARAGVIIAQALAARGMSTAQIIQRTKLKNRQRHRSSIAISVSRRREIAPVLQDFLARPEIGDATKARMRAALARLEGDTPQAFRNSISLPASIQK
jgi:hypothetical protein